MHIHPCCNPSSATGQPTCASCADDAVKLPLRRQALAVDVSSTQPTEGETMAKRRNPSRDERLLELEERQSLRAVSENRHIPRHVLLSETAIDDDPELAAWDSDLYE